MECLKKVGISANNATILPINALDGHNVFDPLSQLRNAKEFKVPTDPPKFFGWFFDGPNLMQALSNLRFPKKPINKPLRIPISDVYRIGGVGTVVCGRIESGSLTGNLLTYGVGYEEKKTVATGSIVSATRFISREEHFNPIPAGHNVGINLRMISKHEVSER